MELTKMNQSIIWEDYSSNFTEIYLIDSKQKYFYIMNNIDNTIELYDFITQIRYKNLKDVDCAKRIALRLFRLRFIKSTLYETND